MVGIHLNTSLAALDGDQPAPSVMVTTVISRLDEVITRRLYALRSVCQFSCSAALAHTHGSTPTGHRLEAHAAARRRRLRISGVAITTGVICITAGLVGLFGFASGRPMVSSLSIMLMTVGMLMFGVAILPTDRKVIRGALYFANMLMCLVTFYACTATFMDSDSLLTNMTPCLNGTSVVMSFCVAQNAQFWIDTLCYATSVVAFLWANRITCKGGRCRHVLYPRIALGRLWKIACMVGMTSGTAWLSSGIGRAAFASDVPGARNEFTSVQLTQQLITGATFWLFAVGCLPASRRAIQKLLAGAGQAASEASAAASISAVMGGGQDVGTALATATQVFRGIGFDSLVEADLDSSSPSPDLNLKAQAARLGEIDFFFSHSWSDSPSHKYALLKQEAERFRQDKGRAPLLWFDRASLDQSAIADSLAHLPVHMAGCKALLICAGSTYTQRLWTLLELFVWVAMGKEHNKIRLLPIADGRTSVEDVQRTFKSISVKEARCFNKSDRDKILTIIESSYGDLRAFDRHVVKVLSDATSGTRNETRRRSSTRLSAAGGKSKPKLQVV